MAGRGWSIAKIVLGLIFLMVGLSNLLHGMGQAAQDSSGYAAGALTGTLILFALGLFLIISGARGLRSGNSGRGQQDRR